MSHGARNGGRRLVAEICVVEILPKCCSQIHKRYVLIKMKTGGLYETYNVLTESHTCKMVA